MPKLADAVLPQIRTRADVSRWSTANEHGEQMHEAVALLENALGTEDPLVVLTVTEKAIASSFRVILRADDSSGIIGDACRRLLDLHPRTAALAHPSPSKLVAWMEKIQFDQEVDYFSIDPVAYAPVLGTKGMALYRGRLEAIAAEVGPEPPDESRWTAPDAHARHTLAWNARRLAVHDRDVDAIIRTHARDRKVAAWLQDTAEAFQEIGEVDLAIEWAREAAHFDQGHQAKRAAEHWCALLGEHRPHELREARLDVFRRWPRSDTAARLHEAAGDEWEVYWPEVLERLAAHPREVVLFSLLSLKDVGLAWNLAHSLELKDDDAWSRLVEEYEKLDPLGALPVHRALVESTLTITGASSYQLAARRLKKMRKLAEGSTAGPEVEDFILELREVHRRRPRLQLEFDRAGLPR